MYIDSVTLNNFRVYKGENTISFPRNSAKNIFVISGDNGFGKTSFLTSLIWCLYGKQMSDVDDKFKKEITESFGYKNFVKSNLNSSISKQSQIIEIDEEEKKEILKKGYSTYNPLLQDFRNLNEFSVQIVFSNLFIPSLPCEKVSIKRTYDVFREQEFIQILIDNQENELTKEVGPEIFINDFILSKDIAKFFFFDSERIVSLAELKSIDDKRRLSTAYSEVLGVKKFEDLKKNMENLRIKLRRKSADIDDREKLSKLIKEAEEIQKLVELLKSKQANNDNEILNKRQISEQYQEKLIREGNTITISELANLKALLEDLKSKDLIIKSKLKEMLDLAPFAIAGYKLTEAYNQMLLEQKSHQNLTFIQDLNNCLKNLKEEFEQKFSKSNFSDLNKTYALDVVDLTIQKYLVEDPIFLDGTTLLNFSPNEQNEFKSIYDNIQYSFNEIFKQLVKDNKNNKLLISKTARKISQAESNENDLLIKEIRTAKARIEKQISELEKDNRKISEEIGSYQRELRVKTKQVSELSKRVSVDESDKQKDETAERIISELSTFLLKLKIEKKNSLEISIRYELNRLMHKTDFINKVQVEIQGDIIDIRLFDKDHQEINKEKLSKGEQQLYATAILKALVEESEIKFPIFIDSPLQKFDKRHSHKIITEFYPNVSEQVIVLPLLEKELSEAEYRSLLPYVRNSYIIRNDSLCSYFQEVHPDELFDQIKTSYVHSN